MARKKEKTLEEKLQEALVPENQWPYILPENWCWTRLDFIANYKKGPFGSSLTKAMFVPKGKNTYKVYEQGNAINKSTQYGSYYITKEKYDSMDGFSVEPDDIIVSCAGTIGEIFRLPQNIEKGIINQALMRVRLNSSVVYQIFEYYFSKILIQNITDESNGTAIKNIPPFKVLKQMPFPLPPLPEQKRIVNRIESLFAKLDEAKEKIQQVLDGAEMRKAAILHKAFTGELTKTWRKENGISEDSWEVKKLKDITTPKAGFAFNSKKFTSEGYQIIRMGNLYGGKLDLDRVPVFYAPENIDEKIKKRAMLHDNDIVITLTGTKYKRDYGYAVLIKEPVNLFINQRILALSPIEKIVNPTFLLYSLRSKDFRDIFFSNETGGVNQGNVSSKFVENIKIKIPLLEEQREIVKVLNHQLEFVDDTTKICKDAYEQIDTMKKSILAKAFRGELGTNNPTEDSALNLLKEVLQDKS